MQFQLMAQTILLHGPKSPLRACICNHIKCKNNFEWPIASLAHLKSLWQKGIDTSLTRNYFKCYEEKAHHAKTGSPGLRSSPLQTSRCQHWARKSASRHNSSWWCWMKSMMSFEKSQQRFWHLFCWESSRPLIRPPYLDNQFRYKFNQRVLCTAHTASSRWNRHKCSCRRMA